MSCDLASICSEKKILYGTEKLLYLQKKKKKNHQLMLMSSLREENITISQKHCFKKKMLPYSDFHIN